MQFNPDFQYSFSKTLFTTALMPILAAQLLKQVLRVAVRFKILAASFNPFFLLRLDSEYQERRFRQIINTVVQFRTYTQ